MKKLFTLIAAFAMSVGLLSAETVELNVKNMTSNATGTTTFAGGYSLTNESSKATGAGNKDIAGNNVYFKISSGVTYAINMPEGVQANKITFVGGTRNADKTTYLKELNGTTFDATDYVFVAGLDKTEGVEPTTVAIDLEPASVGTITFTMQGTESIFYIILDVEAAEVDPEPEPDPVPATSTYLVAYNIDGQENCGTIEMGGTTQNTRTIAVSSLGLAKAAYYSLENGWNIDEEGNVASNGGYLALTTEGGFKAGDIISVMGLISNNKGKTAAFKIHADTRDNVIAVTPNVVDQAADATTVPELYTVALREDAETIYLSRDGGTTLYILKVGVERSLLDALEAPAVEHDAEVSLATNSVIMLSHTDADAEIYWKWEYTYVQEVETPEVPEAPVARVAALSGFKALSEEQPMFAAATKGDVWTLHYYAAKEGAANSEIKTLTITHNGSDAITGVETIVNDANAAVEYYNMQGVKVETPAAGLYIRRQGNTVSKVIVK